MSDMSKPAVIFGGMSAEHDISVSTGLQATHTLGDVHAIYWDKSGRFHLVDAGLEPVAFADGVPRKTRKLDFVMEPGSGFMLKGKPLDISVVVNCCHGGPGEDGTLQGAMDIAQLRYTGPGQLGSVLGMDKFLFSAAIAQAGLPALPRRLLTDDAEFDMVGPLIVKPRFGGSSIGIEVVENLETARRLVSTSPHMKQGAVIEPFIEGCRDLQIAIRTYPSLTLSAIEEPVRSGSGLYSYEQKYLAWGGTGTIQRKLPAPMPADLEARLRSMAVTVSTVGGLRSVARIDFLEKDGELWVNEVNTIPGSLSAYLWIDPPLSRLELLEGMIAEASADPPKRFTTAGADGSALRNAGTVASKLG